MTEINVSTAPVQKVTAGIGGGTGALKSPDHEPRGSAGSAGFLALLFELISSGDLSSSPASSADEIGVSFEDLFASKGKDVFNGSVSMDDVVEALTDAFPSFGSDEIRAMVSDLSREARDTLLNHVLDNIGSVGNDSTREMLNKLRDSITNESEKTDLPAEYFDSPAKKGDASKSDDASIVRSDPARFALDHSSQDRFAAKFLLELGRDRADQNSKPQIFQSTPFSNEAPLSRLDAGSGLGTVSPIPLASRQIASAPQVINAPVGRPDWGDQLSNGVRWIVGQKIQVAELRLDPPHLGSIEVRVKIDQDQASIAFSSMSSHVREAIESSMPRLREMLQQQGISLGGFSVSSGDSGARQDGGSKRMRSEDGARPDPFLADVSPEHQVANSNVIDGLVDLYA